MSLLDDFSTTCVIMRHSLRILASSTAALRICKDFRNLRKRCISAVWVCLTLPLRFIDSYTDAYRQQAHSFC